MDFEDVLERFDHGIFSLLILGGSLLGAAIVQWAARAHQKVFLQIGAVSSACGLPGHIVATRLLAACGLSHIPVVRRGPLNCYHPWRREIRLTQDVYDGPSLSALAVAAHEVGHAQQFASGIWLCRARNVLWPVCTALPAIGCGLVLLAMIGCIELPPGSMGLGVLIICAVMVVSQLPINLPLEHDASRRATQLVQEAGMIGQGEQSGFDRLLRSAWRTHAALEAQRWVMLALALVLTTFVPSFFGLAPPESFEQVAVVPEAVMPEEAYLTDPSENLLVSLMADTALWIVPLLFLLCVATWLHRGNQR
jgi:Zn-dependent membrane protease YugP